MTQATTEKSGATVLTGRSYREWWFILLIAVSSGLLIAGTMMLAVQNRFGPTIFILGGISAFSTIMSALAISRTRFQLEVLPQGFLVRSRSGEREFADDHVICASLSFRANYTNGVLSSTTRTFDVWVEDQAGPEQINMLNRLAVGATDPLSPLIERITVHLYERANAALAAGQAFEGEGWTLHHSELVVRTRRTAEAVRFDSLAAADIFDDQLCVWKHGQDAPVLRIPASSANTQVLLRLLRDRIVAVDERGEPPAGGELGRLLFERKPARSVVAALWLVPVLAAAVLAVTAIAAFLRGDPKLFVLGGGATGGLGIIWALALAQCVEFRVHEHGVRWKLLFRTQHLRYTEVGSFTYAAVRQYVKGVYSGTNFALTFTSSAGPKPKKLTYSRKLRNADAELEHLRDSVSQLIADRMQEQFVQKKAVAWTDGLRFLPEGLEYRASGFFGRKAPVVIPYSQILGFDLNQGLFWLWVPGKKSAVVKENTSQPNFYPGYFFLARLLAARPGVSHAAERVG